MATTQLRGSARPRARGQGITRFVPSIYRVALAAIMGAVLIVALAPRLDTDLWWHLKVGQYIAGHRVVPSRDFMSFTMRGRAWTDHEWLAELAMFGLYSLAGLWGPIVAFALVIVSTFALVYGRMRTLQVQTVLAFFVVAAAFMASSASWGPRIQMLTLLFLATYLFLLDRFRITRDHRLFAAFPAIMLLWANVHGGFVLGLVVLGITLGGEWLNRVTRAVDAWTARDLRLLGLAFGASIMVTIVNPNTYRQLLYPLTFVLPNAYTNLIQESASPNFHMPVMMVFELMLLLLVASFFVARPSVNWTHLILTLAFTHLAFSQVRNVAVWTVVVGPLVAFYLQRAGSAVGAMFPTRSYRRRPVDPTRGRVFSGVLLLLLAVAYALEGSRFINPSSLRAAETSQYPTGAVAYMQAHRLPKQVFVSYSWGGYLLWRLYPRYRDYMDSRADTLFTTGILRGYLQAYAGKPGWSAMLDRTGIGTVLVETNAPLAQLLALTPGWKLAYKDRIAALYTRR